MNSTTTTATPLVRPAFVRVLLLVLVGATIVFSMTGCAGPRVRDEVLLPTARAVYPRVRADIDRGIAAAQEGGTIDAATASSLTQNADDMATALDSGDRSQLMLVPWAPLEGMAVLGVQDRIADGELSEANASLFYQRIVNFREAIDRLAERVADTRGTTNVGRNLTADLGAQGSYRIVSGYVPSDWDNDDPTWSRYYYHNRPRAALGLPLITSGDLPFRPVDLTQGN